ncbi:hypothetical protein AGABI2DRAFT_120584 [Agaricus bisporus var. bisporus H97]|uniref:hypothetical protein n=1 Tax=Agaricus bisporus var. bisporus (strain H97 / ATCC MYA-4626 / FGSC 10389) TaxID=936046 RepID=UPI00029F58EB|nr:hypothetical protein AGABI2DRAFT_120584 [Agaricus bisporus var. bisporus H97]EKV44456.1 hypothetical protein AGABI2DRAFT_120584 [Agaricus bisporus var. bisporus H97]
MEVQRLTSLPIEVLSWILMYIDSSDISAVKKTCQTLCSVTMTRQFWYDRIHRLCEEHVVAPPEEELEEYTIAELEQWSMRRIRARSTSPVKLYLRSREEFPLVTAYDNTLFVPGGRWLLKIRANSHVYFSDLDSSDLEERPLLNPRNIDPRTSHCRVFGNSILWIDHKAPRLSFRFKSSLIVDKEGDLPSTWVYICQVNLTGHGASATLVAQIIATFRNPQQIDSKFVSDAVNDRYFVQERGHELSTTPQLEIFDYRQALERFDYPLMEYHIHPLENYPSDLEFINEDVLAFYCDTTSSYHIFNIESSTSLQHLHQIKLPEAEIVSYQARWAPKATLVTCAGKQYFSDTKTLHGVVVPHERTLPPWTVELGTIPGDFDLGIDLELGIFNSLICHWTDKISRVVHEWDYTCQSPSGGSTRISILPPEEVYHTMELFDFDEDTGRFLHFGNGSLTVANIVTAD